MTISSISQSNYQGFAATGANVSAKPTAEAQPDSDATVKAAEPAKADTDAKDGSSSSSATAPNMFKINPDGTVGPLHLPRSGHGAVHA